MVTRSQLALLPAALLLALAAVASAQENNAGILPDSAADGVKDVKIPDPRTAVIETLRRKGGFTVLVRLFETRGFAAELSRKSNRVTVMAPGDGAFVNLARRMYREDRVINASDPDSIIKNLSEGLEELTKVPALPQVDDILRYHQMGNAYTYEQLVAMGTVGTKFSKPITFADGVIVDFDQKSGNASISEANIFNLNGWLHVVDRVLLPYDLPSALDAVDAINSATATPSVTPSASVSATVTPSPGSLPSPSASVSASPGSEPAGEAEEAGASPDADASPGADDEGDDDDGDDGVCFPAHATVTTHTGATVRMDKLAAHHLVRHAEPADAVSRVFLFTHRRPGGLHTFARLSTACGPAVTLTPSHYLYANGRLTRAGAVALGDVLRTVNGPCAVTRVERVKAHGLYAPHSMHGDIVVDGVVCSGYSAAVAPRAAQALLAPLRWIAAAGVREPMGRAFYNGADWALPLLPRGRDRY